MKKFIAALAAAMLLCGSATADVKYENGAYVLEPGVYQVGKDIPGGHYDARFKDLKVACSFSFSEQLNEEGSADMTQYYSYSFSYISGQWWQAVYPIVFILDGGYVEVEYSPCHLYPVG